MARRRGNQNGTLYIESGLWKARWYVDSFSPRTGKLVRKRDKPYIIGRADGPGKMKRKAAQAILDEKMREVNANQGPKAAFTLGDFIAEKFVPEYVLGQVKTKAGKVHYEHILNKHILPAFHDMGMAELDRSQVIKWLQSKGLAHTTLSKHRTCLATVYNYAADCGFYKGPNPAARVKIPSNAAEQRPTKPYTIEEMKALFEVLPEPVNTMFALGACTSLHGAELAGLRIEHVNLSGQPQYVHDKVVPHGSLYVLEAYTKNDRTAGKAKARRRVVHVPEALHERIRAHFSRDGELRDPREPLFVMPMTWVRFKKALPVDTHNVTNRLFRGTAAKPGLSKQLGFQVAWHRLRATWATQAFTLGVEDKDMAAGMGHASGEMSKKYADKSARIRMVNEAIAERFLGMEAGGTVQ